MNSTLLSVIIPVYNVEMYLATSLDSVVGAEGDNVEIIIVNDGSTDNSLVVCNDYEKKYDNVRVICQENQGLSGARNTGILNATGEYILFLDSDDFLKSGELSRIITDISKEKKDFFLVHTRFLIGLHGTPPQMVYSGISLVTTLPAPMTQPFPIWTPAVMTEQAPTHTSSSIITSAS